MHVAVAVLRVSEGLDFTGIIGDFDWTEMGSSKQKDGQDNSSFSMDESGSTTQLPFSKELH